MPTHIQILGSIVIIIALGLVVFGDRIFNLNLSPQSASDVSSQEIDLAPEIRDEVEIEEQLSLQETNDEIINAIIAGEVGLETIASENNFGVHVNQELIFQTSEISNRSEAEEICDSYAYATDTIWELITCTYETEIIYQDVFIPG